VLRWKTVTSPGKRHIHFRMFLLIIRLMRCPHGADLHADRALRTQFRLTVTISLIMLIAMLGTGQYSPRIHTLLVSMVTIRKPFRWWSMIEKACPWSAAAQTGDSVFPIAHLFRSAFQNLIKIKCPSMPSCSPQSLIFILVFAIAPDHVYDRACSREADEATIL